MVSITTEKNLPKNSLLSIKQSSLYDILKQMAGGNLSFYRKYRPQTLDELLGQPHIKQTLQNAAQNSSLSHAYLFCGPRGTGKTSTARILAKMVNCQGKTPPCNSCPTCISITDGSNLDLIEIDAASNRGIDDIRSLRETIKLSPTSSPKKVYIIDEVHMLTTEAFNALLKTLEEPPSHVLFILATTDPQKIPQTILSRVQRLDFTLASEQDLLEALNRVVIKEKIEVEEEALKLLAKTAEGSFRDSLKLLDQLSSQAGKITLKSAQENLKLGGFAESLEFLESLAQKDTTKALQEIDKQLNLGINIKEYLLSLTDLLRTILLIKYQALSAEKIKVLGEEKLKALQSLSGQFKLEDIIKTLDLFVDAQAKMKNSTIPSLPLEIAVVEVTITKTNESVMSKESVSQYVSKVSADNIDIPVNTDPPTHRSTDTTGNPDLQKILDKWTYVLETIKPYNFSLEALLKQVKILAVEEKTVLLEVPYSFHQRILEAPKSRSLLESVLSDVLEKEIRVSCVLGKRPIVIEELSNIELAADDEIIKIASEIFNQDPVS